MCCGLGKVGRLIRPGTNENIKKNKGKKIVHCHGVFDLLHIGHIKWTDSRIYLVDCLVSVIDID